MGWSWSLWFCQTLHEHLASLHNLEQIDRVCYRSPAIPMSGSETRRAIYGDNFVVLGHDPITVGQAHTRTFAHMNALGLRVQRRSSGCSHQSQTVVGHQTPLIL